MNAKSAGFRWAAVKMLAVVAIIATTLVSCTPSPSASSDGDRMHVINELFPTAVDVTELPMSQSSQFSPPPDDMRVSTITNDTGLLGYWVEARVVSRSGPFQIRVLLNLQLSVKQAAVVSYPGAIGRGVCRPAFTHQFTGKGPGDPLELGTHIEAATGATISSRVMTEGIRAIINQLKELE